MLSITLLLTASIVVGQADTADTPLPADAIAQLQFMAGQWKTEGTFRGDRWEGTGRRRLSVSKSCLIMTGKSNIMDSAGITGWDPATNEIVETWYNSMGTQVIIRYKVGPGPVWKGTVHVHAPEGEHEEGTCRLEKTGGDSFTWTAKTNVTDAETKNIRIKTKR